MSNAQTEYNEQHQSNAITFDEQGFAEKSGFVTVFTTDKNGYFLEQKQEFVSKGGSLANGSYLDKAPEHKDGFVIQCVENKWKYIESHVGETVYNKETKESYEIKEYGPIPAEYTTLEPGKYSKWGGKKWIDDAELIAKALQQEKTQSINTIDDFMGKIYLKFTRFDKEYQLREDQAQAFKEAGYQGEMPEQVEGFAVNNDLTPQQATDLILAQAEKLRYALNELGKLRMQKYKINHQSTIEDVEKVRDELIGKIMDFAQKLEQGSEQ